MKMVFDNGTVFELGKDEQVALAAMAATYAAVVHGIVDGNVRDAAKVVITTEMMYPAAMRKVAESIGRNTVGQMIADQRGVDVDSLVADTPKGTSMRSKF